MTRERIAMYIIIGLIAGGIIGAVALNSYIPPIRLHELPPDPIQKLEVPIGVITSLTGPSAIVGTKVQRSASTSMGEIEKQGGIIGADGNIYIPKLILEDNLGTVEGTITAVRKLIDIDKVKIIVIGGGSAASMAVAPILEDAGVIGIASWASTPALEEYPDFFRTAPQQKTSGTTEGKMVFDHGLNRINTYFHIYQNTDYGVENVKYKNMALEYLGATKVGEMPYNLGDTDLRTQITKALAQSPDVVIFNGGVAERLIFYRQATELGLMEKVQNEEMMIFDHQNIEDESIREGVFLMHPASVYEWPYYSYIEAYANMWPNNPELANEWMSRQFYDCLKCALEAIRLSSTGYDFAGMNKALHEKVGFLGVYLYMEFNEFGDVPGGPMTLYRIVNGTAVVYEENIPAFVVPN